MRGAGIVIRAPPVEAPSGAVRTQNVRAVEPLSGPPPPIIAAATFPTTRRGATVVTPPVEALMALAGPDPPAACADVPIKLLRPQVQPPCRVRRRAKAPGGPRLAGLPSVRPAAPRAAPLAPLMALALRAVGQVLAAVGPLGAFLVPTPLDPPMASVPPNEATAIAVAPVVMATPRARRGSVGPALLIAPPRAA